MNKKVKKIIEKNKYRSPFYEQYKKRKSSINFNIKYLYSFLNKVLISIIILFVLLISKKDQKLNFLYERTIKNMNFMQIKVFLDENFNGLFPKTTDDYKYVDAIAIDLNNTQNYRDGVIVEVNYAEPVVSCVDGIVIRKYNDKDLGQVIVIQDIKGYEYHYGYLDDVDVKIYSNVEYGQILGMGRVNEELNCEYYLAIKNGNDILNVIDVVNNI